MCLDDVGEVPTRPSRQIVKAWKVFERVAGTTKKPLRGSMFSFRFAQGVWVKDTARGEITSPYLVTYPTGFHCFRTRAAARAWRSDGVHAVHADARGEVVRPVRVRRAVAWGMQGGCRVVVAREIFIEKPRS